MVREQGNRELEQESRQMKTKTKKIKVGDTVYYQDSEGNINSMVVMDIDGQALYDASFDILYKRDVLPEDDLRVIKYKQNGTDKNKPI